MMESLFAEQHSAVAQQLHNVAIRLEDIFAGEIRQASFVSKTTMIIYRRQDRKIVLPPQCVIVRTMPGRNMHSASPRIHGHEIGREDCHFPIEKWMARFDVLEFCSGKRCQRFADRIESCGRAKMRQTLL